MERVKITAVLQGFVKGLRANPRYNAAYFGLNTLSIRKNYSVSP